MLRIFFPEHPACDNAPLIISMANAKPNPLNPETPPKGKIDPLGS